MDINLKIHELNEFLPKRDFGGCHIFFSKNVSHGEANNIGKLLVCTITKDLGKYFGMPLIHSRVSKHTYYEIVEKVERCLSGWAASHLSLVGRITLAQSVLQAIHVYAMQTTNLPSTVRTKIDQACKNFIRSGSSTSRKMSLIKWETVCQPKVCYGLVSKILR